MTTGSATNSQIHKLGQLYFKERTEANFSNLYKSAKPLVSSIATKILKREELVEDCVSEIFMKIYQNKNFSFAEDKSFLSWLFTTTRNEAICHFHKKRRRKESTESEICLFDEEGEQLSTLDTLLSQNKDYQFEEEFNIEIDTLAFHQDPAAQLNRIDQIIGQVITDENDAELMRDVLLRGIGPSELKDYYGISSRVTITSRRRRALQKVLPILQNEINSSRYLAKEEVSGEVVYYYPNGKLKQKIQIKDSVYNGIYEFYYESGRVKFVSNYSNGKRNGKYTEFFQSGVLKIEGYYQNDKKTSVWQRFNEDGSIDEIINHDTQEYKIYENGVVVESGIVNY